jgi:nitrite reductase (NADH) large subunit
VINDAAWYDDNDITLVSGDPVVAVDRVGQVVTAKSGREERYDRLLIATGSDPFIIPVPGRDLAGVVTFRDLDDVDAMLAAAKLGAMPWSSVAACWGWRRRMACLCAAWPSPSST